MNITSITGPQSDQVHARKRSEKVQRVAPVSSTAVRGVTDAQSFPNRLNLEDGPLRLMFAVVRDHLMRQQPVSLPPGVSGVIAEYTPASVADRIANLALAVLFAQRAHPKSTPEQSVQHILEAMRNGVDEAKSLLQDAGTLTPKNVHILDSTVELATKALERKLAR